MRTALTAAATMACLLVLGVGTAWAGYSYYESDALEVQSGDAKAAAKGHINWYHGGFPKGYIHRGDYGRNAKVYARKKVGCIWAKVSYGYPNGGFSVGPGGPGGSIDGGSYAGNGYFYKCRKKGHKRPKRLSLYGVGYAKAFLNSSTLEVCTSRSKKQGPRFCSFQKFIYGD
jgi:hypothetical protein